MGIQQRKTDHQKARDRARHTANTSRERRWREWSVSRQAAELAGYSINAHLTAQWGKDPCAEKDRETWRRLRICLNRSDVPWVAMRAPEYAPTKKGHHMHTVFHVPEHAWSDVVAMVELITGKPKAWIYVEGRTVGWNHGVVAKSQDGSWMLQRNIPALGTNEKLISYIAKQSGKEKAVGRHQRSEALLNMTRLHGEAICGPHSAR